MLVPAALGHNTVAVQGPGVGGRSVPVAVAVHRGVVVQHSVHVVELHLRAVHRGKAAGVVAPALKPTVAVAAPSGAPLAIRLTVVAATLQVVVMVVVVVVMVTVMASGAHRRCRPNRVAAALAGGHTVVGPRPSTASAPARGHAASGGLTPLGGDAHVGVAAPQGACLGSLGSCPGLQGCLCFGTASTGNRKEAEGRRTGRGQEQEEEELQVGKFVH